MFNSQYYDYPEGQDCFGKMVATNKIAGAVGLAWSTVDTLMISKPKGYLPIIARYAVITGPCLGMASAFTLATYVSVNARGKDDKLNYFIGGLCAGGVYGAARHSVITGFVAGLMFGIAGVVKKLSKEEGWEFFPPMNRHGYGSLRGVRHDFTLMKAPPKNWTTGKD